MIDKFTKIIVFVSTFGVIYLNYLATTGAIGGITPAFVSDKYPTNITPSGYAFSIWGLIYVGIIFFSIYQLFKSESENLNRIRTLFILSCFANMSWIFAWHYQYLGLSVIAILVLLGALLFIIWNNSRSDRGREKLIIRTIFSIYFGWVSIAAVLNITIYLVSVGLTVNGTTSTIIGCLVLIAVTIVGTILREKFNLALYPLTIAFALTAIGINQSGKTAIVLTCAFGVMALIFSSLTFVLKDHKTPQ